MKRRDFLAFGGAMAAWPLLARAQQVGTKRIAVVLSSPQIDTLVEKI